MSDQDVVVVLVAWGAFGVWFCALVVLIEIHDRRQDRRRRARRRALLDRYFEERRR